MDICGGVYESKRKRILRPYTTLECLFSGAGVIFITIYTYTKILCIVNHHLGPFCRGEKWRSSVGSFALFLPFSYARCFLAICRPRAHHEAEGRILRTCKFFVERCTIANVKGISSSMQASSPPRILPSSVCPQEGRRPRR